ILGGQSILHALNNGEGITKVLALHAGKLFGVDVIIRLLARANLRGLILQGDRTEVVESIEEVFAAGTADSLARGLAQALAGFYDAVSCRERIQPCHLHDSGRAAFLDVHGIGVLSAALDHQSLEEGQWWFPARG